MTKVLGAMALLWLAAGSAGAALAAEPDADFAKKASSGGKMEVELGRYAVQHAADQKVRDFGAQMVTDHTEAGKRLEQVAQREGISLPPTMQADHQATVQRLMKLEGRDFDRAYIDLMVEDHQKEVEEFRVQAQQNASEVDRWAARTLPTLETHLERARSIKADVAKTHYRR
jgi:putative membrane protein